LLIQAELAHAQGVCFRKANHHVWLVQAVPPTYIEVQTSGRPEGLRLRELEVARGID
jgi:RNA:NAD 2'-phosphotransferase (TPT1/KptA family)